MGRGDGEAQCIVYSKRNAKLMNSIELTADGRTAGLHVAAPSAAAISAAAAAAGINAESAASALAAAASVSNLKHGGDVQQGKAQVLKTGRQRLRWNLVFNLMLWAIVPLPLWLPFVDTDLAVYVIPGIQCAFMLFWLAVCVLALRTLFVMYRHRDTDFVKELETKHDVQHMVVISCYKEPVDLIAATVETLAGQTLASEVTMVVSFEEKTPDLRRKQGQLCDLFGQRFLEIIFSIHPFGSEGEIPGKCSNANCGIRTAMAHMKRRDPARFNLDNILVTTCDADSKFHPRYLEALTYEYVMTKGRESCIFQAPLLYNWNLDALCFVTRVTGLVRSFLMMGALIPFNINSMSVFSFPASLCVAGDFIHPAYQMDDIIALIRWMGVCRKRLRIVMIPVPVISGPTSGRVVEEEVEEWARQARRWTIGAAEVFHYFMVKAGNIPFFTALSWGVVFLLYYGVILCCSSLYGVTAAISTSLLIKNPPAIMQWTMLGLLCLQYLVFAVIFLVDRLAVRLTRPRIVERISLVRNLLQWVLSPLVLLGYSVVEWVALHEVMVRGKKVCKHGASKKDALKS